MILPATSAVLDSKRADRVAAGDRKPILGRKRHGVRWRPRRWPCARHTRCLGIDVQPGLDAGAHIDGQALGRAGMAMQRKRRVRLADLDGFAEAGEIYSRQRRVEDVTRSPFELEGKAGISFGPSDSLTWPRVPSDTWFTPSRL